MSSLQTVSEAFSTFPLGSPPPPHVGLLSSHPIILFLHDLAAFQTPDSFYFISVLRMRGGQYHTLYYTVEQLGN